MLLKVDTLVKESVIDRKEAVGGIVGSCAILMGEMTGFRARLLVVDTNINVTNT